MSCRTFSKRHPITEDGRIVVDDINQLEDEDYHDYSDCPNHIMERVLSTTRPEWMDVTCACGMRITIAPHVEAELDRTCDAEED